MEFGYDAGTYVSRTYRIHPDHGVRDKARPAITVKQFQRLLGLMAVASNIIPLGLLHMRSLQWWLKAKGFFPQGESVPYNKGYAQMPSFPVNMEESLVLVPRASIKGVMSPENRFDRRFHHWLGRGYRPLCQGLW